MAPAVPDWVEPMAATLTQERFSGPEWIFERKLDGIRLLAFKHGRDVRLLSRNRLPQQLPHIADAIRALPPRELILDGEVIALSEWQDEAAALAWRRVAAHAEVQAKGREHYYQSYTAFACNEPRVRHFERETES